MNCFRDNSRTCCNEASHKLCLLSILTSIDSIYPIQLVVNVAIKIQMHLIKYKLNPTPFKLNDVIVNKSLIKLKDLQSLFVCLFVSGQQFFSYFRTASWD